MLETARTAIFATRRQILLLEHLLKFQLTLLTYQPTVISYLPTYSG
jgi:hypothetical protein